jgi:hypothetical protein
MIWTSFLHFALFVVFIALGVVAIRKPERSLGRGFFMAMGAMVLLSLPAGVWQMVFSWPGISSGGDSVWRRLIIPFFGWPFNAGGWTVRWFFETTVEPLEWLVGHRSATVLSNMPYYGVLLLIQMSALAVIAALLLRRNSGTAHGLLIGLVLLFLLNSMINVQWFWAGT